MGGECEVATLLPKVPFVRWKVAALVSSGAFEFDLFVQISGPSE